METIARWSTLGAFVFGGLGVVAAYVSAYASGKVTESARLELARLTTPRVLAADHQAAIVHAMQDFRGQEVQMFHATATAEGWNLTEQIADVLRTAGLRPSEAYSIPAAGIHAVVVTSRTGDAAGQRLATTLAKALSDAGVEATATSDTDRHHAIVRVLVGDKP